MLSFMKKYSLKGLAVGCRDGRPRLASSMNQFTSGKLVKALQSQAQWVA